MNQNLVSIITPSYNSERFISDTINSVIEQTYDNWELIIVDDASYDQTPKIIIFLLSNGLFKVKNVVEPTMIVLLIVCFLNNGRSKDQST